MNNKKILLVALASAALCVSANMLIWKLGHVKPDYTWTIPVSVIVGIVFGIWVSK